METVENENLSPNYYRHVREEIANKISQGNHRVLDVGCGAGNLGEYLKQQGCAAVVVGIEINQLAANEASTKLDHVICADLNRVSIKDLFTKENVGQFDYIVCADVLEHLIDPWEALAEMVNLLKPDGRIIVSLPNVRHWSVWIQLIVNGRWDYVDAGILDRTHLRFFTKSTACELFERAGFDVEMTNPLIGGKSILIDKASMGVFREVIAVQWVFVCKKR